jgi:hypothetical protein
MAASEKKSYRSLNTDFGKFTSSNVFSESYRSPAGLSSKDYATSAGGPLLPRSGINLPGAYRGDSFGPMSQRRRRENRVVMREGDRILINKGISKKVMIIARTEIPHSTERIFVTKSGGKYTIGLKVWRSDYVWSEKNQMWVPKH